MFNIKQAFEEIARGDKAAIEFMGSLYLFIQKQDDLHDQDKPVTIENSVGFDLSVLRAFGKNEFFQKHQDFVWPALLTSALAYIASEDLRQKPEILDRITAQVLKSEYLNVFLAVAFCVGGWDWSLAMSKKYREYAFDNEPVKESQLK